MSKRILVLANSSDGLYGFRKELLSALSEKGNISVSVPDKGWFAELRGLGCKVIDTPIDRRGINPITDLKLLLRYWKLLKQEKPDIVVTYTIKPNIYGGLVCRMLNVPYAVNITGLGTALQNPGLLCALVTMLYKLALKKAKVVFFENAGNMQNLLDTGIVREAQCRLLAGAGVNVEHYAYAPYPESEVPTKFLFVGRMMREKGIDELFSAMQKLNRDGFQCTLDVLGSYEENYADKIDAYTKEGWLHYHGHQKDVRPFIENAHCFVLPSWHEGMANTNLECAAMGRPLITSNIHGCKEAVVENVSGLLCQPQNQENLYETMVRFLQLTHEDRVAMGRAGRKHMEEVFDKNKVVEQTLKGLGIK